MNVQNNKLNAINNNMLLKSITRDIDFGINKKPSLDGLNKINLGMVDKPFFNTDDIKLDLQNNLLGKNNINDIVQEQINNIKNDNVLNTKNVAKIVSMKYENNNGKVNGELVKTNLQNVGNNKVRVNQMVKNLPDNNEVIKTFEINLNDENNNIDDIEKNNLNLIIEDNNELIDLENKNEIYAPSDNKFRSIYNDMIQTMDTNKILTFGIIVTLLIIMVIYIFRCKCKMSKK